MSNGVNRKIYITFGGANYDETTARIVEDGPKLGADEVWVYDDMWLMKQEFYSQNKWLWDHPHKRGFGWYSWKPFIIHHALQRLNDGDIVLYTDADTYPVRDFSILFTECAKNGIMLFEASSWMNLQWCKRDCYIVMAQDESKYWQSKAGCARFMLFQRGKWPPLQFLMEWLTYCVNPLANTFDPSVLGQEAPEFREHRVEQSMLTLLAHKYGYKLYREADQHGAWAHNDKELYQPLFWQETTKEYVNITAPAVGSRFANIA